eukprot:g22334.t1
MKLFRNNITDGGAWAVGQFMAHSSQDGDTWMGDVDDKRRMISLAVKQLLHLSCLEFIALFLFRCSPTQLLIGVSLISNCLTEAVHEVHLSHNSITERGACGLLEQIAWSRKYPYDATAGGRDGRGLSPIWLRLEHNCIDWRVINHRLQRPDLTWCTAESRDGWLMSDQAPTICLHGSYRNQHDKVTWEEGDWGESAPW